MNGVMYFYLKDAKNEIYAIMNSSGNIIGTYSYDPYGNILSISDTSSNSPLVINPFRYKGYYYDIETGLYYLKTRYYNPLWGRFISPDNVKYLNAKSINGLILYAYCDNDPVNKFDPSGCMPEWAVALIVVAVAVSTIVIDTVVETVILMTSEEYKAEAVYKKTMLEFLILHFLTILLLS